MMAKFQHQNWPAQHPSPKRKLFSAPGLIIIGGLLGVFVLGAILLVALAWLGRPTTLSAKDAESMDRAWDVVRASILEWEGGVLQDKHAPLSAHRLEMLRIDGKRASVKNVFHVVCYLKYDIKDRPDTKAAYYCTVDEDEEGNLQVNSMMGPQTSIGDSITFLVSNQEGMNRFDRGLHHVYERVETTGVSTFYLGQ